MACGLSAETGKPVVITCTGATASRNYLPALTEAFYRKLPIISITGTEGDIYIGNLQPQVLDRSCPPIDAVKYSISVSRITDEKSEWHVRLSINKAISEVFRNGGGPVNISIQQGSAPFKTEILAETRIIRRIYDNFDNAPLLPDGKIAIFCSSHKPFSVSEEIVIDKFCRCNNSVVFCDNTSSYHGIYRIDSAIIACQSNRREDLFRPELLIHIGEISGEYYTQNNLYPKSVWRVSQDGEMRDRFKTLDYVFEMCESKFFSHYINENVRESSYYKECVKVRKELQISIPDLPFSNIWIAQQLHKCIPSKSSLHFGILNSLRSWNFFVLDSSIKTTCNVGGFGIDGPLSTTIGASLADIKKKYFCIVGDLAFFYDMNSLGNRHIGNNLRVLLVNNGHGTEFSNYDHPACRFGSQVDNYIAAGGHYGNKSRTIVRHYVEDLGFLYFSASTKQEFIDTYKIFVSREETEKPILFEVFTNAEDESNALRLIRTISQKNTNMFVQKIKQEILKIINK